MRLCICLIVAAIVGSAAGPAFGQAYCALRDPTRRIYEAYPTATNYKSIVRTVDENVRQQVATQLPFTIHFNELGRHTVYLPVEHGRPLGLIHARSERGQWGLVEIVWSLTPTLEVADYSFQRCRARNRTAVEDTAFKKQLVGLGFNELRGLLTADGNAVRSGALRIPRGSEQMATTIVRSALKTISVTRLGWAEDLRVIRPLYQVYRAFPDTARADVVANPYHAQALTAIESQLGTAGSTVDRGRVTVIRALDGNGQMLGHLVRTPWSSLGQQTVLWWTVRHDLVIEEVAAEGGWPNREVRKAFEATKGLAASGLHNCSSAAEIVGAEVLLLSRNDL